MGCGRKGPQRNFPSPAAQAKLGLVSSYRPSVPTHWRLPQDTGGVKFLDVLCDPAHLWASGDPSVKCTEGNVCSL